MEIFSQHSWSINETWRFATQSMVFTEKKLELVVAGAADSDK